MSSSVLNLMAAFLRRDWTIAKSYRLPFVMQIFQSFTGLVLVYFMSRLFAPTAGSSSQLRDGYFAFAAIGLSVLSVISSSLVAFSQRLRTDQTTGTFEMLLASPARPSAIALFGATYDLVYAAVSALFVLVLAIAAFGLRLHATAAGVVVAVLAVTAAVGVSAAIGVAYAAFVVVFKRSTELLGLVSTALGLLGGVYFPVSLLPTWLRVIAEVIPVTQATTILRNCLLFREAPWAATGVLIASAVVLLPLSLWTFEWGVHVARQRGTLAQY